MCQCIDLTLPLFSRILEMSRKCGILFLVYYHSLEIIVKKRNVRLGIYLLTLYTVTDLDIERPQTISLGVTHALPHDYRKIEDCLINMNKGEDDDGCLKFCNILKYIVTVQEIILKGLLREYSAL